MLFLARPLSTRPSQPDSPTMHVFDVVAFVGVSRATIYRMVEAGKFPRPFKVGSRTLWRRRDVELWVAAGGNMAVYREAKRGH